MKSVKMWGFVLSVVLGVGQGIAWGDQIQIGAPSYGGTGCPVGTAQAVLSPDASRVSILFDQFEVEAGGDLSQSLARKTCNVALPVHVPTGFQIGVPSAFVQVEGMLAKRAVARLSVDTFLANLRGARVSKTWVGSRSIDEVVDTSLRQMMWSGCGEDVILRVSVSATLNGVSSAESYLSVGVIYPGEALGGGIEIRQCH